VLVVAAFAAIAEGVVNAAITDTRRSINSAARDGSRSYWFSAQRYSIATSRPSAKPASLKPRRNAATDGAHSLAVALPRTPITGIACCARAASGHAAAAPPRSAMKLRRVIRSPRRRGRAPWEEFQCQVPLQYFD